MRFVSVFSLMMLIATAAPAEPENWTVSGSVGAEVRWFPDQPQFEDQFDGAQASAILAPEFRWRSADRRHQVKFSPFARLDGEDDERTHFDLREAYYRFAGSEWEFLAGVNQVFWGVTESRHLVDVINQRDMVEDIDGEDKLGQPMLNLAVQQDWGRLDLYALIGFRERTSPGSNGRLRPPLPVDQDAARFASGAGDERIDWAVRWSHFLGDWDIGAFMFRGTDREPLLFADPPSNRIVPFYDVITQGGIDVQLTHNAWLWKLEALARNGRGTASAATVAGFEYTLYQVGSSAADLGLLFEYLYDGRDETAPPTIYDQDIFLGARLALNDVQDTEALVGALIDAGDGSTAAFIEAERRLGDRVTVEFEGRFFLNVAPEDLLTFFDHDNFVAVRLSWNL